jgi:formate/nitrite transporter FocA (FNT family)
VEVIGDPQRLEARLLSHSGLLDQAGRGVLLRGKERPREPEVEEAFDRLVSEGTDRLARPLVPLLATGFVGGIDVGVGGIAYLVVDHQTRQPLLAAAVFPIGFIALLLARSELFTENFLVPVTARIAGRGS